MSIQAKIWRDKNGTPHVIADSLEEMYKGLGYMHARDRGMQMILMRILGQGRGSELLDPSDEMLGIDTFFRRMNWHGNTVSELEKLSSENMMFLSAYCEGVNQRLTEKSPWEFKLLGYKPEAWKAEDSIMLSRMIGYLTLSQSQGEMERLLVELVQAGISQEKLEVLFPGILGGLDIDLIKQVKLHERIVNPASLWGMGAPRAMASNNWVVSGKRTKSGKPILANDIHLETNRLPGVWYEVFLQCKDRYMTGGSMPGIPGILAGRNPDLSWGVTYSFVDATDSWIEKVKSQKYYREDKDEWLEFKVREEVIKRKKKDTVTVKFYENQHGSLDGSPEEDGYYLSSRWAASDSGAEAFSCLFNMWLANSTEDGMNTLGPLESSWDFVFADTAGNIGFQMTGRAPIRRDGISGFVPLPGWKAENDWQGYHSYLDMPRVVNPEKGYFSTANHDLNRYGKISPINMPMGSYRADRIDALLAGEADYTVNDVFKMHGDLYSRQAAAFMNILKPLLPDTEHGEVLKNWDMCYDAQSQGAFLFEKFYKELYREVFGKNGIGQAALEYLMNETGTFIDFYQNFDSILLSETSTWFEGNDQREIFSNAIQAALKGEIKTWGSVQQFTLSHILFGGKLPGFLGFDRGPITGLGGRATIHQGQIYRSAGRVTTFMPSFRFVIDMSEERVFSNMAGGPSDRRFSKWYVSDLQNWIDGKYKITLPGEDQEKLKL